MKNKFTPFDKMSKKAKREANKASRAGWGINPVTRTKESRKRYNRAEFKKMAMNDNT